MRKVPEREAAKAANERFYWTGIPCKNGHLDKRYTGSGTCATCSVNNTLKHQAKAPHHPNRIAAREAGLTHYSTGRPCIHGHDKRFVATGHCAPCEVIKAKRWLGARPDYAASAKRRSRATNPIPHRKASKKWAKANPTKHADSIIRWKKRHPQRAKELAIVRSHRRRTRLRNNGGDFTLDDIVAIRIKQNFACAACGDTERQQEIDHIIPVRLGGSSYPSNLQLLCFRCNRSKSGRHPDDWAKSPDFPQSKVDPTSSKVCR